MQKCIYKNTQLFYTTKHYINASIKQSKISWSMTWYSKYISMVSSISNVIISLHENEAVTILLYHCDIWEITFTNIFNFLNHTSITLLFQSNWAILSWSVTLYSIKYPWFNQAVILFFINVGIQKKCEYHTIVIRAKINLQIYTTLFVWTRIKWLFQYNEEKLMEYEMRFYQISMVSSISRVSVSSCYYE